MINPGAVGRHGRLGILVNTTLVRGLDGRLYFGSGGSGGGEEQEDTRPPRSSRIVPLPPRLRKRIAEQDDVWRDDSEILLFIGKYVQRNPFIT
jgi:hypothetical protein